MTQRFLAALFLLLALAACAGGPGPVNVQPGAENLTPAQLDSLWQSAGAAYREGKWDDALHSALSRSEVRIHPYRNVIYRSIGADEQIEIDIVRRKLASGDMIMLCSDGLNSMLSDDQIRDIMMVNPDPNTAAKELVVAANAAGGEDNTSIIVVKIT